MKRARRAISISLSLSLAPSETETQAESLSLIKLDVLERLARGPRARCARIGAKWSLFAAPINQYIISCAAGPNKSARTGAARGSHPAIFSPDDLSLLLEEGGGGGGGDDLNEGQELAEVARRARRAPEL